MTDIIDQANQQNEVWLASHLAAQRAHKSEAVKIIANQHVCIDCDNPINPERVEKMPDAPRCIDCQTIFEHKGKHFA